MSSEVSGLFAPQVTGRFPATQPLPLRSAAVAPQSANHRPKRLFSAYPSGLVWNAVLERGFKISSSACGVKKGRKDEHEMIRPESNSIHEDLD
jgi:hypothetical protein